MISQEENKMINQYRRDRKYAYIVFSQIGAILKRKIKFQVRNLKESLFEILVPALMIFIGLSLTKVEFKDYAPSKDLVPSQYLFKQRLLVNDNLVKLGGQDLRDDEDGEDFEDEDWPSHLPVDIQPSEIMRNLPLFDQAFTVDYYNPVPEVDEEKANEISEKQRKYEDDLAAADEEYDTNFEKTMLLYLERQEETQKEVLEEFEMRVNKTYIPPKGKNRKQPYKLKIDPYAIKKRFVSEPGPIDESESRLFKKFIDRIDKTKGYSY